MGSHGLISMLVSYTNVVSSTLSLCSISALDVLSNYLCGKYTCYYRMCPTHRKKLVSREMESFIHQPYLAIALSRFRLVAGSELQSHDDVLSKA
jgi:hypothetical protein